MPTAAAPSNYTTKQLAAAFRAITEEISWIAAGPRIVRELGLSSAEAWFLLQYIVNATAAERDLWSAVQVPAAAPPVTFTELTKKLMADRQISYEAAQLEASRLLSLVGRAPTEPPRAETFAERTARIQRDLGLSWVEAQAAASGGE